MNQSSNAARFVVATPWRSVCDDNARVLENQRMLRLLALGTRKGTRGVPSERTRLNPLIGLGIFLSTKILPAYWGESARFRSLPWFDNWVCRQLQPGDHIISSYGYTNACFRWVRQHGGKTFVDAGNSHPENYWTIISEEHRRWKSPYAPFPPHWYRRSLAMMEEVDYVLCPSNYVKNSFLARGFKPGQILRNVYPTNLDCFFPAEHTRPKDRPLSLISTGTLSLRKGTPYLLEAFRMVLKKVPKARLMLTRSIQDNIRPVLAKYADLPIDWAPPLPHSQLAARLREADIFLLPSLEEGLARTSLEALACGLPAIVTPHTGSNDLVIPDVSGEVVPIRDPQSIADAVLKWWERISAGDWQPRRLVDPNLLTFEHFQQLFLDQLRAINLT